MKSSNIYKNGTYTVIIDETGTKKYVGEVFIADFPDSLDLKITEQCLHGCPFCHENSEKSGKHGDLEQLVLNLKGLPKGVELAVGGGNALLHPNLKDFLIKIKDHFKVALTIHWKDLVNEDTKKILEDIIKEELITSLGISLADIKGKVLNEVDQINQMFPKDSFKIFSNIITVFHVIPGVTPFKIFKKILWDAFSYSRILVLGFKQFGRAKKSELPIKDFEEWKNCIQDYNKRGGSFLKLHKTLAFDNLALEQLDIKNIVSKETWEESFMGEEFTHSMYVDACKGEYAPTSRSPYSERSSWENKTVIEYFKENHL